MKQKYWFKVWFGKWDDGSFDPENTFVFVEAWDAGQACRKAMANFDIDEDDVLIGVEYVGYPQIKKLDETEE